MPTRDRVALILAIGTSTAFVLISGAALFAVISARSLSENATQVLTAAFGGMTGVLGSYLGFRAGMVRRQEQEQQKEETDDEPG